MKEYTGNNSIMINYSDLLSCLLPEYILVTDTLGPKGC